MKKEVTYSILSADLASPAPHCLHSVISDFRPPSVAESSEAAFRRLLASRAMGGYALTSDDPAPGSPTRFQSSRVPRPQDASKAPCLGSLLRSSARSFLDAYSSVCFVVFLRLLTSKPSCAWPVAMLILFSSTVGDTQRCFVRDLIKAGSRRFC